jgi:hypothetical protein
MIDIFTQYEKGLNRLLEKLGLDHPRRDEAMTLQKGLKENIAEAERFGNTDSRRAKRAEIVDTLNQLATETIDTNFSELCWTDKTGSTDLQVMAEILADRQSISSDGRPTFALDDLFAGSFLIALEAIQNKIESLETLFYELSRQGITITGDGNIIGSHNQVIIAKEGSVVQNVIQTFAQLHQQVRVDPAILLADYQASLIRKFSTLDLRQISWLGDLKLPLDNIYVKLQATGQLPIGDMPFDVETLQERGVLLKADSKSEAEQGGEAQSSWLKPPPTPVPIEIALQQSQHLVILGEPGSGKTTLLHYLTLQFARKQARSLLSLTTERLPIYVRLGKYAEAIQKEPLLSLPAFIVNVVTASASALSPQTIEEELHQGRCILLLDALDEVPEDIRQEIAEQIDDFLNSSIYSSNRLIVTSRIAGYLKNRLQAKRAKTYTLRPFQPTDIEIFTRKWFQAVAEAQNLSDPDNEAELQTRAFLQLARRPDLARLLTTPLLLQLAVTVFVYKKKLPLSRAELYGEYFEPALTERVEKPPYSSLKIRGILSRIAWQIHHRGRSTKRSILEIIDESASEINPDIVFDYIHERLGLLADFGERRYDFTHLTFREYFVANYLHDQWQEELEATWQLICPIRHKPNFREPILLLAGLFGYYDNDATEFIRKIWEANDEELDEQTRQIENILSRDFLLAGWCMVEIEKGQIENSFYQSFLERLQEVWRETPYSKLHNESMEILGIVGDLDLRTKLSQEFVEHFGDSNGNVMRISFEDDFAVMRSFGYLGIVNDEVVKTLSGFFPEYDETVQSDREERDWVGRFARAQLYDAQPISKLRVAAIDSLERLNVSAQEAINDLLGSLKLSSSTVRERAADVLIKFSDTNPEIIRRIAGLLNEYVNVTRNFAASLLVQMAETNPIAVHALVEVATKTSANIEKNWSEREIAVKSLGKLISNTNGRVKPEVFETLIAVLLDRESRLQQEAAESLVEGLPFNDFELCLKIVGSLILVAGGGTAELDRSKLEDWQYVYESRVQQAAVNALATLLERDIPPGTLNYVYYLEKQDGNPFYPLITSDSIVLRTIMVCIILLMQRDHSLSDELIEDFGTALLLEDQEIIEKNIVFLDLQIDPVGKNLRLFGGPPKPGTGADVLLRSLFQLGTIKKYMESIITYRWHEIQGVLNPILDQLPYRPSRLARQLVRNVLQGVLWSLSYKSGLIPNKETASSIETLHFFMRCLIPIKYDREEETQMEYAVIQWGQFDISPEVIEELCSIAEKSNPNMKRIAAKLLGQVKNPPNRTIRILTKLLSDQDAKRDAAESLAQLGHTDDEIIGALLESDNFLSTNIWYTYAEPSFFRALGLLANDYDDIDEVLRILIRGLRETEASSVAAAESLGLLGQVRTDVVEALIEALASRIDALNRAATQSLIQLARIDQVSVLETLISGCKKIGRQLSPTGVGLIQQSRAQWLEMEALFMPIPATDTHNYAYEALWAVVESIPAERD